jgi:hypothetical protein
LLLLLHPFLAAAAAALTTRLLWERGQVVVLVVEVLETIQPWPPGDREHQAKDMLEGLTILAQIMVQEVAAEQLL